MVFALALACLAACAAPDTGTVARLRPEVLGELPHATDAFTEGFEVVDRPTPTLYESTGLSGRSQLRELDPVTGALRRAVDLPAGLFGEGLTVVGGHLWQLTYRDGVALDWDRSSLTLIGKAPISGEGWGLCHDGARLVRSDGTDVLRFHDPTTFAEIGSVRVTRNGRGVAALNELECTGGRVYANVWRTSEIVEIDPADGHVTATINATGLLAPERATGTDVMNGIAALGNGEFLLTGKYWPVTFRVRFVPAP